MCKVNTLYHVSAGSITVLIIDDDTHTHIGKVAMMGQDTRKACVEFVEAIHADPTHFGAYKCQCNDNLLLNVYVYLLCGYFTYVMFYSCMCVRKIAVHERTIK